MTVLRIRTLAAFALFIAATGCNSDSRTLVIRNTSETPIRVLEEGSDEPVTLGLDGVASSNAGGCLFVGDASISFSNQIEVANVGDKLIELAYVDAGGRDRTMILGQGGIGYFSALRPVKLGDLVITKTDG